MEEQKVNGLIKGSIWGVVLAVLFLIFNPLVIVKAGHRGVVINGGGAVSDSIRQEGISWKWPIYQSVKKLDVQTQKLEIDALAYSKDIQTVTSKLALNYHLKPEVVNKLYQEVGKDYQSRLIDPAVQESVKAAEELINQIIDNDEKVVVFSNYNEPLEALEKAFKDVSVRLTGDTPEMMRRVSIDAFQNDSKIKVFLGGMKAAGVGITLTAGQNVLFIDYSWVPSDHLQAQDRIHRIGQNAASVTIYQLYAKNTIDEKMKEMLAGKQELFNKIFDGSTSGGTKSLVDDLLKDYELIN